MEQEQSSSSCSYIQSHACDISSCHGYLQKHLLSDIFNQRVTLRQIENYTLSAHVASSGGDEEATGQHLSVYPKRLHNTVAVAQSISKFQHKLFFFVFSASHSSSSVRKKLADVTSFPPISLSSSLSVLDFLKHHLDSLTSLFIVFAQSEDQTLRDR